MREIFTVLRRKRARTRYEAHKCPKCAGPVRWIPEAPGCVEGKACKSCAVIWARPPYLTRRRVVRDGPVRVHPYARLV